MNTHPNAAAALTTGGAATLLLFAATRLGLDIGAVEAGLLVTFSSAAVLFAGRRGIKGLARLIWRGEPNL